jgi:hypothetical protein
MAPILELGMGLAVGSPVLLLAVVYVRLRRVLEDVA